MKTLFKQAGLPICGYTWLLRTDWEKDQGKVVRRIKKEIGFPCFVKPVNLGSSVGVSKATDKASLTKAIDLAARYDRKIMIEEEIVGREIECAVGETLEVQRAAAGGQRNGGGPLAPADREALRGEVIRAGAEGQR